MSLSISNAGSGSNRIVIALLSALALVGVLAISPPAHAKPKRAISVYPLPGTPVASDATTFSFRGIKKKNLGPVTVTGSKSGRHTGRRLAHSDGRGVSYIPKRKFVRGELVRVKTKRRIRMGKNGNFWVRIGRFYGSDETGKPAPAPPVTGGLRTRPGLKPPNLQVKTKTAGIAPGKIFFAPKSDGLTIADGQGRITWFRPTSYGGTGEGVYNFRTQKYRKRPVLTYWKGASTITGYSQIGFFEILNRKYNRIARFEPANGYKADIHEFVITPRNTALVLSYRGVIWNMKKFGGPVNGHLVDNVVQEIDIKTGAVIFEWHAIGNVSVGATTAEVPKDTSSFDYFHTNSIQLDGDSFLVSARKTSSVYRIDRATGKIKWVLRGSGRKGRSDFKMGPGTSFAYQHDALRLPNGDISVFDNGSGRFAPTVNEESSGLVVRLSGKTKKTRKATLVRRNTHPDKVVSASQANAQPLSNGGMFIGWGSAPQMTEFDKDGSITFDAVFPDSAISSYRAYKAPWHGIPRQRPAIASQPLLEGGTPGGMTVWASWNGASNIANWRVLAGPDEGNLTEVATHPWENLETEITVGDKYGAVVQVEALDRTGKVLGKSAAVSVGKRSR